MALRIDPDGKETEVKLAKSDADLKTLQDIVGGYIEIVNLNPPTRYRGKTYHAIVCDEDGLLHAKAVNNTASNLAGMRLVGTVVLANKKELH